MTEVSLWEFFEETQIVVKEGTDATLSFLGLRVRVPLIGELFTQQASDIIKGSEVSDVLVNHALC